MSAEAISMLFGAIFVVLKQHLAFFLQYIPARQFYRQSAFDFAAATEQDIIRSGKAGTHERTKA